MLGAGIALALAVLSGAPDLDACAAQVAADPGSERGYRCLRDAARRTGTHAEAFARLEGFLAVDPGNELARWTLAGLDTALGGKRAEALYEGAIAGFAERGEPLLEARARLEWVEALQWAGRTEDAERHLAAVRQISERVDDESLRADLAIREAAQAFRRSDHADAEARLERIRPWIESNGTPDRRAAWLAAKGAVASAGARWHESLAAYTEEAEFRERIGDLFGAAGALANVTLLRSRRIGRGDPTDDDRRALAPLLDRAAAAARAGGNLRVLGTVAFYRAQLSSDPVVARTLLEEAVDLLGRGGDFSKRLIAMRYLGEFLVLREPRDEARSASLFDEAFRLAYAHGDLEQVARCRIVEASLAWRLGDEDGWKDETQRQGAMQAARRAVEAIEALRDLQSDEGMRAAVFSNWVFFHDRIIGHLLGPPRGRPDREAMATAFEFAERMRARVLLERLDTTGVPLADPRHAGLLAERQAVTEAASRLRVELANPFLDDDGRAERVRRFEAALHEEARIRQRLAAADPRFERLRAPTISALAEAEGALASHEAILAFNTGSGETRGGYIGGGSWLMVHTRDGTKAYPVPPEEELATETALYAGLFENPDPAAATAGERLHARLLGPALDDLDPGVTDLVLVPDGPLHRVPFAALRDGRDGRALAERYALSVSPSVAAWLRWRRDAPEAIPAGALIVADPWVDARVPVEVRGSEGSLPYARIEANRATERLPGTSRVLGGSQATEASLKSAAFDRFGVLHVAAHARLDEGKEGDACIVLAPGDGGEDGRLTVAEASSLDLDDRVVVLAACRTAGGPFVEGEGVLSLSRGFLVAGARAVIGSLWPLRDDETAEFFDAFYRRLGEGAAVAEAFAGAQRDRIAAGASASAWAGLVLIGDGTVRLEPPGLATPALLLTMALAAGCLLWVLRRGRARI